MSEVLVRTQGRAGRITLNRPKALNAITYGMVKEIHAALERWRNDTAVEIVLIDAVGDKAFSAGGDIADLYNNGKQGDYAFGHQFWRDEYRMNFALQAYDKPIISFLQGFTMGGGMGVGCHGSHRVVGASSQIAMPECGIGLVPDVGGSLILANAPNALGAYFGITGARMNAANAILAGFADMYIPEDKWPALISALEENADLSLLTAAAKAAPDRLSDAQLHEIDHVFNTADLTEICARLEASSDELTASALKAVQRNSPLAMAVTLRMMLLLHGVNDIREALKLEYRFTARAMEHGDFLEGIRAAIIDKDRRPKWKHKLGELPQADIDAMMAPLGALELTF
ncbi:enoyl-CoA hydratase/isomerase family protein [Lentibacter algarum]|uniref:enoyl-CoA hydratase/isomerase family protein n=1 Tax=Lentibacter algarum TaxID=576131 RepID=UPI001C08894C|nr:enoyl-CoA hydratase/isomerase family protein [Lentibacter algarum]MBU2982541.1 enoyl-CoA hydratase/isomerase family protein [Lentibacter algarum]